MAKRVTTSISKKLSKMVAKHKGDETTYGVVNLPGGISNGIAKLIEAKFGKYAKGKYTGEDFFRAAGVVVSPEENGDGVPVKGLQTSIMIPLCDTTNAAGETTSAEEHGARLLNELRKLGANTDEMEDDGLEELLEVLVEEGPYFRFTTSQSEATEQFPNPRVWENWHGNKGLEDYVGDEDEEVTEDEPEPEEEDEDEEVEEDGDEDGEEDEGSEDPKNLDELAAFADDDPDSDEGQEAAAALTELAEKNDLDPNEYESWADVVEALSESEEDEDEGSDEEEEEIVPEKEEVYFFKPPRKRKAVECEVTAVFKTKQTCNLKDLENDGKVYKGVAWSDLQTEE